MQRREFGKRLAAAGLLSPFGGASLGAAEETGARAKGRDARHLLITFSWGTGDLGGIGIVPGLLNLVRKAAPELPTTVITLQSGGSGSYRFLKDYLPRFLPACRVLSNPFVRAFASTGPDSAFRAFRKRWSATQLLEFDNGSLSARTAERIARDMLDQFPHELYRQLERQEPAAAEAIAGAGFVLYPSGTTLNFGRAGQRSLLTQGRSANLLMSIPLLVARALKIPYGVGAQSFDAVEWPVDLIYRPLFKQARFVHCRDTDSLEYLRQRDLLNARSAFRPDSTFFFPGSDEPWADAYLRDHGLKSGAFMTVIGRFAEDKGPISGAVTAQREQQQMAKYKRLMEGWIEKTGMSVLICPEAKHEAPQLRARLFALLSPAAQQKCVCMDSFWTPEQACSIYRRARLVVGHMHTIIFALSVGTPVLHIPFAEAGRKAWMVKDVGLGDWLLDIDETPAEALLASAVGIHQAHDAARQRVRKSLHEVERLGLQLLAEIRDGWRKQTLSD